MYACTMSLVLETLTLMHIHVVSTHTCTCMSTKTMYVHQSVDQPIFFLKPLNLVKVELGQHKPAPKQLETAPMKFGPSGVE